MVAQHTNDSLRGMIEKEIAVLLTIMLVSVYNKKGCGRGRALSLHLVLVILKVGIANCVRVSIFEASF